MVETETLSGQMCTSEMERREGTTNCFDERMSGIGKSKRYLDDKRGHEILSCWRGGTERGYCVQSSTLKELHSGGSSFPDVP